MALEVQIKKLHHPVTGQEIGAILTAIVNRSTNAEEKAHLETALIKYAFDVSIPASTDPLNIQ